MTSLCLHCRVKSDYASTTLCTSPTGHSFYKDPPILGHCDHCGSTITEHNKSNHECLETKRKTGLSWPAEEEQEAR